MAVRYPLAGRTALVTGAARGIGAETARVLAGRGAKVSLVGLEPAELEATAASCGPEACWFEADVTDTDALAEAVSGTVERLGGIDVVMANAGIAAPGMVRNIDPAAFERTLEINLLGSWRTIRACLPHVIERRGYVLQVASMAAIIHAPGMAAYAASKAGVEAFADSLREEVRHLGVRVGVAYYSWIDTDMVRGADEVALGGLRERLRGPAGRTYPVSFAAERTVRGIERRSSRIFVPPQALGMLAVRGLLAPLVGLGARRVMPEADAIWNEEIESRGAEASRPVGPGGRAGAAAGKR